MESERQANRLFRTLGRAVRLRCPRCGATALFRGWFSMADACALCGLRFERVQGYFVGAIYINYAVTAGVARGKKGTGDVIVDNRNCVFVGHVTAVVPGDRVRVRNSDPVLHNTHGFLGQPTVFNLALPTKDQMIDITKRLQKPGVVRVLCDAHPPMFAWMIVHDSPYVTVTDASGAFRIGDVPPGTYKVTMWHAGFRPKGNDKDGRPVYDEPRTMTKELTIAPKATATVEYELR